MHPKDTITPGSLIIHGYYNVRYDLSLTEISSIKLIKYQIDNTNYNFDPDQVLNIDIELNPIVKPLSIKIMGDTIFNTPCII